MKKIYGYILMTFMLCFTFISYVSAGSYSVTVTSNSVTVGNSVTLKITGSSIAGKFTVSSSNTGVLTLSQSSVWIDNDTASITVNTKSVGKANITITPTDVTGYDGNSITGGKTITITVNAKPAINNTPKVKSSNNFLTSLSVNDMELDKTFDKETLEYTVNAPEETEKIKINAQLADSTATVTGIGEKEVSTGNNTFSIVVTAENGSKRTYTLNVIVKELKSINVKVDKEELTVVRKEKDLPEISEYFTKKEVTINDEIVPGYVNDKLKYTVVGLKDNEGKINYYIYDDGKYTLYREYVFNALTLQILDKEVENFKKTNFIYGDEKINSYQEVKMDIIKNTYALTDNEITGNQFYLFYAKNVETGKENLYQYDAVEKTVQRYNLSVLDMYRENSNTYYMYLLIAILGLGVTIILFSIILICKSRKKKRK